MYKACSRKISPTKLPAELVYIKLGLNALLLSDLHVIQYIYIYYIILYYIILYALACKETIFHNCRLIL